MVGGGGGGGRALADAVKVTDVSQTIFLVGFFVMISRQATG